MKKILIVDDEEEIRRILEVFLNKKGFLTLTAKNGDEALKIIESEKKIDLLILDVNMPGTGGEAVMLELEKRNLNIPTIVLTGTLSTEENFQAFKTFRDLQLKPINLSEFLEKINKVLGAG